MYAKFVISFCAVGIIRAGSLLEAASIARSGSAVVTKTSSPSISSYSSYTHNSIGTQITSYNIAPIAVKSAITPVVAAYYATAYAYNAPVTSSFSNSTAAAQSKPSTNFTLGPIVAKADTIDFVSDPVPSYATTPTKANTITAPVVSSVSSYSTYTEPVAADSTAPGIAESKVTKSIIAPAVASYAAAPAVSYSISAPIIKSAVSHSAGPAVSVYSGHGAS